MSFGKVFAVVALFATAISPSIVTGQDMSGSYYGRGEHRRIQSTRVGFVEGIREVTLNTQASNNARIVGGALGAGVAGIAGRKSNQDYGVTSLLMVLGGVGGAVVADRVAEESRPALEIVVRLDQGNSVVIVQESDPNYPIRYGDRVRLIEGREVRVASIR